MPNLSISKSRRSTSSHSRRIGSGRNNNRRTQGGKKKQQGSNNGASVSSTSSTAAAIAPYIPKPLSDMHTNFLQKFERLSSLIDDTLKSIDGIVSTSLCADIRDGLMDEKHEVADDAKSMFDDATFVLGSIEDQTNKVCKNYCQAAGVGIQDVSTDLTAVNTSDERSLDRVCDTNNKPSMSEVQWPQELQRCNFASWLASQEFVASVIVSVNDVSLLEDKAKNAAVDADQKKPSPTSATDAQPSSSDIDIPSSSKDQEDEDIVKKLGLVPCENSSSSNMPLQPKNLNDSLFSNTSSHVSSLTGRVTTKSGGGPGVATDLSSVATPLAGEDLLDGVESIKDTFATPNRFDCNAPSSDVNTPGGIDSCTYSVSPFQAQPAAHLSSELTTITDTSISKSTDPFETTPFPSDNGTHESQQDELEDDTGRSDTPLMCGFSSSDSNDQTHSSRRIKAKGRMRRRMRLKN